MRRGDEGPDIGRGGRNRASVRLAQSAALVRSDLPLAFLDAILATFGYVVVLMLRYDGGVPSDSWASFLTFIPVALTVHLAVNMAVGLYGRMWRHASIVEARRVLGAGAASGLLLLATYLLWYRPARGTVDLPASIPVLGAAVTTMLIGALRFQSRLFAFHRHRDPLDVRPTRVAVIGAGEAGAAIVAGMQRSPEAGLRPVALLDDDPRKQRRSIGGVPIVGFIQDLPAVAGDLEVDQVLLAIPSADASLVRRIVELAEVAEVPLKVLPSVTEMVGAKPSVLDVRDVRIDDLLGRQQVDTDLDEVGRLLAGRRVLVTGGGGSIGSEIVRQVSMFEPAALLVLDHDETLLHDAMALVDGKATAVLADVRNSDALERVFERHAPEIVFHAAALKHVPVLEDHPSEAIHTNMQGTMNLLNAASRWGVERLVFISTDKAVRPSSVMGASKWLGEQLVLGRAPAGARYSAVRFGNVLGSRGSVIPTFRRQIAAGGPVTVTHPEMTRFFMSVQEAVQLVLQAAAFSEGGEVFMLEMGEPMRIVELAKRMISLSGHTPGEDIEIHFTGMRPGEKMTEELRAPAEMPYPTPHPSIVSLYPQRLPKVELEAGARLLSRLAELGEDEQVACELRQLANRAIDLGPDDDLVIDLIALEQEEQQQENAHR